MKKHLINLYKFIFFKNPKRPYLLWWQIILVYIQWVIIIGGILLLFGIGDGEYKNPQKVQTLLFALVFFGAYTASDQKQREVKIRFIFNSYFSDTGIITGIVKNEYFLERIYSFLRISQSTYRIKYKFKKEEGEAIFEEKKLTKYFPDLQEGSKVTILISKGHPNFFIWDFETIYFKINKNYKVRK